MIALPHTPFSWAILRGAALAAEAGLLRDMKP